MKTKTGFILIGLFALFFITCRKDQEKPTGGNKIELGLSSIDTITYWTAKLTSSVLDLANNEIIDYGHCWSANSIPTINDNHTSFGSLTLPSGFTSSLEELEDGTLYHVRVYFTMKSSTVYLDDITFQTIKDPCNDVISINYEGKEYAIVPIGNQCWMSENLNVGTMISGDQQHTNEGSVQKYCYDNNEANCDQYGALYQWDELMNYSTSESIQGICPQGWHIPSDDEWKIVEAIADDTFRNYPEEWEDEGLRGSNVGKNLKSTNGWDNSGNGIDKYGFNALPGGRHTSDGSFLDKGTASWFWTSTTKDSMNAFGRTLYAFNSKSYRFDLTPQNAKYVRCIKDVSEK